MASSYLSDWTITAQGTSTNHYIKFFPRRWIDITGRNVKEVWNAALRSVIGLVLQRPSLSQVSQ